MTDNEIHKQILLEWTSAMSVEVGVIDEEHKRLIGFMNALYEGVSKGQGKEALKVALDNLILYTMAHFQHEEDLFEQTNYPEAQEHKALHDEFREKIKEFTSRYEIESANLLTLDLMRFLKEWVVHHILGVDKKYSAHFHAHGIN